MLRSGVGSGGVGTALAVHHVAALLLHHVAVTASAGVFHLG